MKLLSISLVAAALCWTSVTGEPINRIAPRQPATATVAAPCPVTKTRKTIVWNYFLPPWPRQMPRYVQYADLTSSGSGRAWREAYGGDPADHFTREILFENNQGWSVVNCTWKYAADDPARKGCTSPDTALLNTPSSKVGDEPSDKGKIGTINGLTYPAMSPWAIYDLVEFRLTPVVEKKFYTEQISIEVYGWHEDGSKANTMRFKIKGSETGYKVSLPKGEWDKIIQWQVRVWWSSGSRETRQEFPFLIDDVVIDEYAVSYTDTDTHCLFPTQTPTATSPAFDDITASPTAKPLSTYKSYSFTSDWAITDAKSYPSKHPGSKSATSKPNALYSANLPTSENKLFASDFLFDIDTFHITIDNTLTTTQVPADLVVSVYGYTTCFEQVNGSPVVTDGSYFTVSPTAYGFDVDLKAVGFRKQRGVVFSVWDNVGGKRVPFWVDGIVVRSWKDGLKGLPGCERCSSRSLTQPPLTGFCEYPVQLRV